MAKRPFPSLADYAVIAISPALIMGLVGSLVFFLIEVFYSGAYDMRLNFIMAMFVMAAVLIARISIEQGRGYAVMFAIPLAIVTAIATLRFVEFGGALKAFSPLINIGLIALIWWCADKLTWDSTVIDESQDASGEGLLQTTGLDPLAQGEKLEGTTVRSAMVPVPSAKAPSFSSWWRRLSADRKRPHAPGVWVIYFSLAALPIFGFGNWFIPSSDLDSRRYVFKLLVAYVGSALALLVTTSFLGLRRYLRQRRLEMPVEMSGVWIGTGVAMIVALLLICMLLPRRNAEYSVTQIPAFAGSPSDLWTTEYAVGNEGQEDPEKADRTGEESQNPSQGGGKSDSQAGGGKQSSNGQSSNNQSSNDQSKQQSDQGSSSSNSKPDGSQQRPQQSQGESNQNQSKQNSDSKSQSNSQSSPNGDNQGKSPGENSQQGTKPEQSTDNKSPGKQPSGDNQRNGKSRPDDQSQSRSGDSKPSDKSEPNKSKNEQGNGKPQSERRPAQNDSSRARAEQTKPQPQPTSRFDPSKIPSALGGSIGQLLKLLYWVAVIAIVGYVVWRYHREIRDALRNFLQAMRGLWESLFGSRPEEAPPESAQPIVAGPPPKPFASFADPFLTGMADAKPASEVVRYSFEALEAWARDRGFPRGPQQTPHEFAQNLGRHEATLARDAAMLAELYARCAYSKDGTSRSSVEHLRRLWLQLRGTAA